MYIAVGLSGGTVSFISPALGRNDRTEATHYFMHFLITFTIVVILVPICTLTWVDDMID